MAEKAMMAAMGFMVVGSILAVTAAILAIPWPQLWLDFLKLSAGGKVFIVSMLCFMFAVIAVMIASVSNPRGYTPPHMPSKYVYSPPKGGLHE